jgi:hypothetical protein
VLRTEQALNARDEMLAQARVEGIEMPVARLLRRINDPSLSEQYRDTLSIALAPYTAPRLSATALIKSPSNWTDAELKQVLGMTEESLLQLGEGRDHWPVEITNGKR